jgi:hypothetical protein
MRKIFYVFSLILSCTALAYGQAAVDIPMSASDGSALIQLAVGLDLTATNGIDPALGESDLPPFPPAGVFEFRFDLTPYAGEPLSSYRDYRAPGEPPAFPFSDTVQHRMIWQRSEAGLPIDIQYDLPPNSAMVIQDEFGGILLNLGPLEGSGTATIPGALPLTSAFLYMIYTDIVPVELTSFTAAVVDGSVLLNWTTATETNNRGFEVEKQSGNSNWESIGFVTGKGTTTEPQSYSFTDNNIANGRYTYRLKQIDYDGSYNYSNEVEVVVGVLPDYYSLSQNYPNPFNPTTAIQFQVPKTSDVTIKIYDLLGQEIKTLFSGQVQQGTYTVEWNGLNNAGTHMSSGTYVYRISTKDFVQSRKMILMK